MIIAVSDAAWVSIGPILSALTLLVAAIGTLYSQMAARRTGDTNKAVKSVQVATDAQTEVLKGIDEKADTAATTAKAVNQQVQVAAGKLETIGNQTNGTLGDLRKQLDTLYQSQIATFRETQHQLVEAWAAQQIAKSGDTTASKDAATVARAVLEALHATPHEEPLPPKPPV